MKSTKFFRGVKFAACLAVLSAAALMAVAIAKPEAVKPLIKKTVGPIWTLAQPPMPLPTEDQQRFVESMQVFPADNPWNTPVDALPTHPLSLLFLESVGLEKPLHPDFGAAWNGAPLGIPYGVVDGETARWDVEFEYGYQSDPGPYPIPPDPPIEGGADGTGDRHLLLIDVDAGRLYELFALRGGAERGWTAGSGAVFDLKSNELRPEGWTSADAAGLPIFPGLVRFAEVEAGEIDHALRFTVKQTRKAYVPPARHYASSQTDPKLPPMGMRVRLRADYDISSFPPQAQVVLRALKRYGMILADNGGDWFLSGTPDSRWDADAVASLRQVTVGDFEVVDTGPASDE